MTIVPATSPGQGEKNDNSKQLGEAKAKTLHEWTSNNEAKDDQTPDKEARHDRAGISSSYFVAPAAFAFVVDDSSRARKRI